MPEQKTWMLEEIEYLQENAGNKALSEICSHLNKSTSSVKNKARKLGLSLRDKRIVHCWTPQEIAYLKENAGKQTLSEISSHLNRGEASVVGKAGRLGLSLRYKRVVHCWTPEEIEYLKENAGKQTLSEISSHLNRSEPSVERKAGRLGISLRDRRNDWQPEEIAYLQDKWGKMSISAISKHLNRRESSVKVKRDQLKLGSYFAASNDITLNQFLYLLFDGQAHSKRRQALINKGLPVKRKQIDKGTVYFIDIKAFWKWAEHHRNCIDFSRLSPGMLGKERPWVKEQRQIDQLAQERFRYFEPWTAAEEKRLRDYLKQYRYTYPQLSELLKRSYYAIAHKIYELDIQERPVAIVRPWSYKELETMASMIKKGMNYDLIALEIQRTPDALQWWTNKMYKTSDLDQIRQQLLQAKTEAQDEQHCNS